MSTWLLILIIILTIGLWSLYSHARLNQKLKNKSEARGQISKSDFVESLVVKGYEQEWISKLYDRVQFYVPKSGFSMSPEDSLVTDYKIHEPDILDIANELYEERNGMRATNHEIKEAEEIGATIYTFEGILKFVCKKFYQ